MQQTEKLFGTIGAMQTLLENFPMGILDFGKGKRYTSAFNFIIDLLYACGVDTNQIIEWVLSEIYGIDAKFDKGIEGLYDQIGNMNCSIDSQNKFLSGLEDSIKVILMGLFTSLFTCSANPIIPDDMCDYDDIPNFMPPTYQYKPFLVPIRVIDFINMFSIPPTTSKGRLYYLTDGRDKFYAKTEETRTSKVPVTKTVDIGEEITVQVNKYSKQIRIAFNYNDDDEVYFTVSEPIGSDINITMMFLETGKGYNKIRRFRINGGSTESGHYKLLAFKEGKKSDIVDISVNNRRIGGEVTSGDELYWVYLSKEDSMESIVKWEAKGGYSYGLRDGVSYGYSREDEKVYKTVIASAQTQVSTYTDVSTNVVFYNETKRTQAVVEQAVPVIMIPEPYEITEESPMYIKRYNVDGENPNMLYKSYDMNAFIWYVINRGSPSPQVEYNHMMWDSRVSSYKNGIVRNTAIEWNDWYHSKSADGKEFMFHGNQNDAIYPIIQLEKYDSDNLLVKLPAQRYFMPSKRNALINSQPYNNTIVTFNSSLYRFDWDYLKSIQLLNPKLLLTRLCEELIGLAISEKNALNFSIINKSIKAKLSKAVKSMIESDDMEIEDCYKTFSNDDFNEMLESMNLARYTASQYNGETNGVRIHDLEDYIGQLDSINEDVSTQGSTETIKKLVTSVSVDPGTEAVIEYEIGVKYDSNIIKKLIWAIVMPIIESLFTPQVMLLIVINCNTLGIVRIDNVMGQDFSMIFNFLLNKVLSLTKSIIIFIKDKILSILLKFLYETILPMTVRWACIVYLERIEYWLETLAAALICLPSFSLTIPKLLNSIEDVDYADIVNNQTTPESSDSSC